MNLYISIFLTVFLAELGDKTQLATVLFASHQNSHKGLVFLAAAKHLRVDNNLVFLIDRSSSVITLNRSLAGLHFGAFVVGDIALNFFF